MPTPTSLCTSLATMRTGIVFFTVVAFVACASLADHHTEKKEIADKTFLQKQRNILRLLYGILQPNLFKDQMEEGMNYNPKENIDKYEDPKVVWKFMWMWETGTVTKWEPFSLYKKPHWKLTIALFDIFYFAKDFDTFYKTALWAKGKVNPKMFYYTISVAIRHREDTKDILLPPPYEVYPFFFAKSDVIQKAEKYRMKDVGDPNHHTHIITVNQTWMNMDQKLSYFTEDPGLSTFIMHYGHLYPSWFNFTLYGHHIDHWGRQFYYTHKMLYNNYFLNRLSHNMPDVEPFVYTKPIKTGFYPKMMYHNGQEMPPRPKGMTVTNFGKYYITEVKNYERRILDAIDSGKVYDANMNLLNMYDGDHGLEYLGLMMGGSKNSPNYYKYGSLMHLYLKMIGWVTDPQHTLGLPPSALEHPDTALRDPVYYQVFKRMDHFFQKYYDRLPHYTHEQLGFEGVKVENMDVGKLYTYFEPFEFSLDNAVYVKTDDIPKVDIGVRQWRLNHKPFTYKLEMTSEKATDVYVKVFLGPKYDYLGKEYDMNERRHYFVELDTFPYHVQAGKTVIERNSEDFSVISPDPDRYRTMYKKVQDAFDGKTQYYIDRTIKKCGYPANLLLPKGQKGGMTFTLFVIVTPYVKQDEHDNEHYDYKSVTYCGVGHGRKYPDDKPMGFPLDREIQIDEFYTPNMYFKDVNIFHKSYEELTPTTH